MNIPSPLPGRTFASTCVASHADVLRGSSRTPKIRTSAWEASTCATSLNEFEFITIVNWNKANHNFTNVVRALHLTLKWREKTTFPLYLFQLAVGCSCRIQNSFQPRNETSRANYLSSMRPCNILYFLRETTHICKYLKIHRLSWAIYILPLSIGLRQIDPFDRQYTVIILRSLSRSQCRRRNCY